MNQNGILAALMLSAFAATASAAVVPIDLNTWSKRGPASNGNWVVAAGGSSVNQTINGDPTFFVSGVDQSNTTLRGRIRSGGGDDDFIGFVFGFSAPIASGNDMDYVLFDWKAGNQSFGGFPASEGFALSRVQGTITDYVPGFWGHTASTGFTPLDTNFGNTMGWQANVDYDFEILYQDHRIRIDISGGTFGTGQTIFDIAGNFPVGSFGFYNYSQAGVTYSGLTEEATPPPVGVPEPASVGLVSLALAWAGFAGARRRVVRQPA